MWGRNTRISYKERFLCLFIFLTTPFIVFYSIQTAFNCDCDIFKGLISTCIMSNIHIPNIVYAFNIIMVWILFQLILALLPDCLHKIFPSYQGGIKQGNISPAGYIYDYNINGLQ